MRQPPHIEGLPRSRGELGTCDMTRARLRLMLLCFLVAPSLCAAQEAARPAIAKDKPIVVGQIASRTGNNPGGKDNEQGAALAAAEINANGGLLGGRVLELR